MSSTAEIENAIENLPPPQVDELAGWLAAQAFLKYRRSGGTKTSPLPDFYIGAQAEIEQRTLVTRDAARYRRFPKLSSPYESIANSDTIILTKPGFAAKNAPIHL